MNMAAFNIENRDAAANSKQETAKGWLQRHIRKIASRQTLQGDGEGKGLQRKRTVERPCTAPSTGVAASLDLVTAVPRISMDTHRVQLRPRMLPPIRPARPHSSVIRDVNAWLEASMNTPPAPLMAGLSYWREALFPGVEDSAAAQHAVPLFLASGATRPSPASNQQGKTFRRCARKMQAHMPSMLRTKGRHLPGRQKANRQSASILLVAAELVREDSMGDVSEAPSYFSGPPPPSYRSRPESVLTISSFGCIDGMNPAQRQISQQRAALQRGMRCKLKRLAQDLIM